MPSLIKSMADSWQYSTVCKALFDDNILSPWKASSKAVLDWAYSVDLTPFEYKRHMIACRAYLNPRQTLGNVVECVKPDLTTTSSLLRKPLWYTKATILFGLNRYP